ncbi:MAG TPA: disulfide bond formation protein B [Gammaproteobacteria bacterium]|nr:disulfide bond formation protein B [Gammaproteobacteria bacterium]
MRIPTPRTVFLLGFLACIAMMGTALIYFQFLLQLEPCPLCIMQRMVVISIAVVLLVATLHNPRGQGVRVYGALVTLVAATGAAIAGRHVYLQNLPPDQVPECGPGLDYILEVFPLSEALQMVLHGSGECAEVLWRFLGLSIPGWTLIAFSGFILYGLFITIRGPDPGLRTRQ